MPLTLTIDSHPVTVPSGQTVLDAARKLGLDIPTLCYLEKCGPLTSCQACLVKINGKLVPSCATVARSGMVVESETDEVHAARRTALELLFSDHVGDCLAPCNRLCPLGMNVPAMLRSIQAGRIEEAAALVRQTLPLPGVLGRLCHHPCQQGCRRGTWDEPAAIREVERFAANFKLEVQSPKPETATAPQKSGKTVVIIGAGPAGLAAATCLARKGIECVVLDRRPAPGGSLHHVKESELPKDVLQTELRLLEELGVRFKSGVELGHGISITELLCQYSAVLLTMGETSKAEGEALGLKMTPGGIHVDADGFQTTQAGVFAAGRAVKPASQLVRVLSEGQAAAEAIEQFLSGQPIHRPSKPFSSIMGRLEKSELALMAEQALNQPSVMPCDMCAGLNRQEAATESSRCLHCDCRSSGSCALQRYARIYGVNPSRFRHQRRTFEQYVQPGGVIFEPGKCIRCGICIKLTEQAAEPLGLSFVGRGFNVRVAAPFGRDFEEGLLHVARECAHACPTGAIVLASGIPV